LPARTSQQYDDADETSLLSLQTPVRKFFLSYWRNMSPLTRHTATDQTRKLKNKTKGTMVVPATENPPEKHIVLFYKYHPLSNDIDKTAVYRNALEKLCESLLLKGRILVAHSESEGINGTVAGEYRNVRAFTYALLGETKMEAHQNPNDLLDDSHLQILKEFWKRSDAFFAKIGQATLEMNSPDDFKWSRSSGSDPLFPDLNIKLVKELIGTGGVMAAIPLEETAKGYLTPQEWHKELQLAAGKEDTVLIDCRNTKEWEIGRFQGAMDPNTTTFSQFPKWVDEHRHMLANKNVFMYCTGGIRCE
jgi:UPF0176 protein